MKLAILKARILEEPYGPHGDGALAPQPEGPWLNREEVEGILDSIHPDEPMEGPGPITERFTETARRVMTLAIREALSLGHNYVAPEHIALGLLRETESIPVHALERLDITVNALRDEIIRVLNNEPPAPRGDEQPTTVMDAVGQFDPVQKAREVASKGGSAEFVKALALLGIAEAMTAVPER